MPISSILSILKIGLPIAIIFSVGLYISSLRGKVDDLTQERDNYVKALGQAVSANKEQVAENTKLRDQITAANHAKELSDQKVQINETQFEERINEIKEFNKRIDEITIDSARINGDTVNDWFVDWMLRVEKLAPGESGSDQDGKKDNPAPVPPADPTKADPVIILSVNRDYAEWMQTKCDESKYDDEGMVDEDRAGDPTYCNWSIVGFASDKTTDYQVYMEKVFLYIQKLIAWGKYYEDAANQFEKEGIVK